jgi:hypothetical protein
VSLEFFRRSASLRFTRGYRAFDHLGLLAPIWRWHWTVLLKLLALLMAVALSAILGIYSWKSRPQLSEEPQESVEADALIG